MHQKKVFACLALSLACLTSNIASAHFPWLIRSDDGKATLYFGENLAEKTYKLPPSIAAAEVKQFNTKGDLDFIKVDPVETESLIGLQSLEVVAADACLISQVTFGIYHGSRLNYYSMHRGGKLPSKPDAAGKAAGPDLDATLIDTAAGVDVFVTWQGQPLADAEVHLYCAEGHEEGTAKSDESGRVSFTDQQVEAGLNGIMVGHKVKLAGKLNEVAYDSEAHYLTVTFFDPEPAIAEPESAAAKFAPLPFAITSFGAARAGDSLYVYGGHTGEAHAYWNESQSNKLLRLDLSAPNSAWQEVAEGERRQGLGMVAYKHQIILIGGFTAKNKEGDAQDLHSSSQVRAFDTIAKTWSELPELPESRSSHDAALLGDTLYVIGGWKMAGSAETIWHQTAWAMDLSSDARKWVAVAKPPFTRRALAAIEHQGKLFAIGGMNEQGGPTKAVAIYDPNTDSWSEACELIGEKAMAGFGASGWSIDGKLIVTTYEGDIQQWVEVDKKWELIGKVADARFFHRLLPLESKRLVAIGGANMEIGKFLDLEVINAK